MVNNRKINAVLVLVVAVLVVLCFMSVSRPMRFDSERAKREQVVKQWLLKIRTAETAYVKKHGLYCGSVDSLMAAGMLDGSLATIPYGGGKPKIETSVTMSSSGKAQPLMECGVRYEDYLKGLDGNMISSITDDANAQGSYPGLKIGGLDAPNGNAANWE